MSTQTLCLRCMTWERLEQTVPLYFLDGKKFVSVECLDDEETEAYQRLVGGGHELNHELVGLAPDQQIRQEGE